MSQRSEVRFLRCLLIGAIIEIPLLIWYFSITPGEISPVLMFHLLSSGTIRVLFNAPAADAIDWAGTFVIQSCINGAIVFGLLLIFKRPAGEESTPLRRRILTVVKFLLIGAAIETLPFVWFSKAGGGHGSVEGLILGLYHFIALTVAEPVSEALKPLFSERTVDAIWKAVLFLTQSCVVGAMVYVVHRLVRRG